MPRTYGDAPRRIVSEKSLDEFASYIQGCTRVARLRCRDRTICPVHTGMYLGRYTYPSRYTHLPRICGDVPNGGIKGCQKSQFASYIRGCTFHDHNRQAVDIICPVIRGCTRLSFLLDSVGSICPVIYGDVPYRKELRRID